MNNENTIIAHQDETISHVCWRAYGNAIGMVEPVLAANNGLCDLPTKLPAGTQIVLPAQTSINQIAGDIIPTINLWD